MPKPKVLFLLSFNFQIRYLIRSGIINRMAANCEPLILLMWNQPDLKYELEEIGFKVILMPYTTEPLLAKILRNRIDHYYFNKILKSETTGIRLKHKLHLLNIKKKVRFWINNLKSKFYNKSNFEKDKLELSILLQSLPEWSKLEEVFKNNHIDHVFTTAPFLLSEELVCRVACFLEIPIFYSVLSFDNPTTRGFIPFIPKRISVWNNFNKEQLGRIWGEQILKAIDVTGPPQFDFYFKQEYALKELDWRITKNMPLDRLVIMYGANAKYFIPEEYRILELLDNAIESGRIIGKPIVLLRPHPTDSFADWDSIVKKLKHTYIERSIGKNESEININNKFSNFTFDDITSFCSTLANTKVHISYASTLALDGICFNKPQICPYFSPAPKISSHKVIRNLYHTEHYEPITKSGAVLFPDTEDSLIEAINSSLNKPDELKKERENLNKIYLNNTNGNAVDLLVKSFQNYLVK